MSITTNLARLLRKAANRLDPPKSVRVFIDKDLVNFVTQMKRADG